MEAVKRKENWPVLLREAIAAKARTRACFGIHDCCISVCDLIESMTGLDVGKSFRGYRGKEGMQETLDAHGGVEAIAEKIMEEYGYSEINPRLAQRGDTVLLNTAQGDAMGTVGMDGRFVITAGARGWVDTPISHAKRAWRIG